MSATFTPRGRAIKQAYASNSESWGNELNTGAVERLDEMWGVTEVTVDADVTLTSENAIADQSRQVVLILSGAGGFEVTAPAVDKPYLVVNNCTSDITIKPTSGTAATVRAGRSSWYYTNAAGTVGYVIDPTLSDLKAATADIDAGSQKVVNVADATAANDAINKSQLDALKLNELSAPDASVAFGSQKITGLADGVDNNDAVNKSQLDGLLALTPISTVAAIETEVIAVAAIDTDVTTAAANVVNIGIVAANDTNITTVATNIDDIIAAAAALDPYATQAQAEAGIVEDALMNPLRTKQAIEALGKPLNYIDVTGDVTLVAGNAYRLRNTASDTLTLPASPTDGQAVRILDSGIVSSTIQPIIDPLTNDINGNSGTITINQKGIDFELWFNGSEWRFR